MDSDNDEYSNALMEELGNEPETPPEEPETPEVEQTTDETSDTSETPQGV